jgi:rubrerythrin
MRVRPQRPTDRRSRTDRRAHIFGRQATEPAAEAPPVIEDEHRAERRHRESVAPEDQALYRCQCGFAFEAAVTTSVVCPHCGAPQAW